jgi:hypothetical protein
VCCANSWLFAKQGIMHPCFHRQQHRASARCRSGCSVDFFFYKQVTPNGVETDSISQFLPENNDNVGNNDRCSLKNNDNLGNKRVCSLQNNDNLGNKRVCSLQNDNNYACRERRSAFPTKHISNFLNTNPEPQTSNSNSRTIFFYLFNKFFKNNYLFDNLITI